MKLRTCFLGALEWTSFAGVKSGPLPGACKPAIRDAEVYPGQEAPRESLFALEAFVSPQLLGWGNPLGTL